jgi:hypothetical protein
LHFERNVINGDEFAVALGKMVNLDHNVLSRSNNVIKIS